MGRNWVNYVYRTRWVARLDVLSVDSFCNLFPAIQTALEIIAENIDDKYSRRQGRQSEIVIHEFLSISNYCKCCDDQHGHHTQEALQRGCKVLTEI